MGHAVGPAAAGVLLAALGAQAVLIASGSLFLAVAYLALTSRIGEPEFGPLAVAAPAESLIGGG
jgi:hypothetical protein